MAKAEKEVKKTTVKKDVKKAAPEKSTKKAPPKTEAPEFGIAKLAKALGIDERATRLKLRNAEIEKSGRTYDFKNQAGVDKLVKQFEKKKKSAE